VLEHDGVTEDHGWDASFEREPDGEVPWHNYESRSEGLEDGFTPLSGSELEVFIYQMLFSVSLAPV